MKTVDHFKEITLNFSAYSVEQLDALFKKIGFSQVPQLHSKRFQAKKELACLLLSEPCVYTNGLEKFAVVCRNVCPYVNPTSGQTSAIFQALRHQKIEFSQEFVQHFARSSFPVFELFLFNSVGEKENVLAQLLVENTPHKLNEGKLLFRSVKNENLQFAFFLMDRSSQSIALNDEFANAFGDPDYKKTWENAKQEYSVYEVEKMKDRLNGSIEELFSSTVSRSRKI